MNRKHIILVSIKQRFETQFFKELSSKGKNYLANQIFFFYIVEQKIKITTISIKLTMKLSLAFLF